MQVLNYSLLHKAFQKCFEVDTQSNSAGSQADRIKVTKEYMSQDLTLSRMRKPNLLKIITGLIVGLCGQVFFQILTGQKYYELSPKNICSPCGNGEIRADQCPFCGPDKVTAEEDSNVINAYKPKGMYEVTRWYYFDETHLYDIINGEPKVKLLGSWYEETRAVMQVALEYINTNRMLGKTWSLVGLENGYIRTDVFRGTDYILDLNVKPVEQSPEESFQSTFRVRLVHAFEGAKDLKMVNYRKESDVGVHIIVPLSGTKETVTTFINSFASHKEKHDLKLTLVLFKGRGQFGEESGSLKPLLETLIKEHKEKSKYIDFIEVEGNYNYLRGINQAKEYANHNDIILTSKIDMRFGEDVLQSCRLLSVQGKRAYFPIAFSQYDPDIIERGMPPGKPKNVNKLDINKFTGYWMHQVHDFMCAYGTDLFPAMNRVLMTIHSEEQPSNVIGNEGGTRVYDSFLSNDMEVISSVEPDLIRLFRQRKCDKTKLSDAEYHSCFQIAAEMLGSKPALSILYLTEIALKKV